jgi:hypothetical protein
MREFVADVNGRPTPCVYLTAKECEELKRTAGDQLNDMTWGTFGPDGTEPLAIKTLRELDTEHLENILITQPSTGNFLLFKAAAILVLRERYKTPA